MFEKKINKILWRLLDSFHLLATPLLKSKTFHFLPEMHNSVVSGEHDTVLLGSQVIFEVI